MNWSDIKRAAVYLVPFSILGVMAIRWVDDPFWLFIAGSGTSYVSDILEEVYVNHFMKP